MLMLGLSVALRGGFLSLSRFEVGWRDGDWMISWLGLRCHCSWIE